jgi:hypothetical protein
MYFNYQIDLTYDVHRDSKFLCVAIGDLECMIIDCSSPKHRKLVSLRYNLNRDVPKRASFV